MFMNGRSKQVYDEMCDQLIKLSDLNTAGGIAASGAADQTFTSSQMLIIALLAIACAIGLVLALIITRNLLAQLGGEPKHAAEIMQKIAAGDLSSNIAVNTKYPNSMLFAIKEMQDSLIKIVSEIRSSTDTITTVSSEIASGNLDLSQRTEEQASSLEETASSMEELTSTVKQNADNAHQATISSRQSSHPANARRWAIPAAMALWRVFPELARPLHSQCRGLPGAKRNRPCRRSRIS